MDLYIPTRKEIDHAVQAAAALAPSLWSYLVYAGCLLRGGDLTCLDGTWVCRSASDPPTTYAVEFGRCTCPHCRSRRTVIGREAFCSHRLALLLLCDICLAHVRLRLLGPTSDPAARSAGSQAPDAGLLLLRFNGGQDLALVTPSSRSPLPRPVCQMVKVDGRLGFAAERDLAAFGSWLSQAQQLPAPVPLLIRQAEAAAGSAAGAKGWIPPALTVQGTALAACVL